MTRDAKPKRVLLEKEELGFFPMKSIQIPSYCSITTNLTWTSCILLKRASESNTTYCRNNSGMRNYSNNEDCCNKIHIKTLLLLRIIMPYTTK